MSFLAIDIGNTRLKWAQYAASEPGAAMLAHGAVFLETIDILAETIHAFPSTSRIFNGLFADALRELDGPSS